MHSSFIFILCEYKIFEIYIKLRVVRVAERTDERRNSTEESSHSYKNTRETAAGKSDGKTRS